MANTLTVDLVTPTGTVFSDTAIAAQAPGVSGSFEVRYNHAPLITTLGAGKVKITLENGETKNFHIPAGVFEVLKNKVTILAEKADID